MRELENILERALALCDSAEITPDDLGLRTPVAAEPPPTRRAAAPAPDASGADAGAGQGTDRGPDPGPPGTANLDDELVTLERERIREVLEQTRYNKTAAARRLGISFRALRYRLKKLGLE